MNLIERLKEEMHEQIRNGRREIYVSTEDLKKLEYKDIKEGERQFIDIAVLKSLMTKYEFISYVKETSGIASLEKGKQNEEKQEKYNCWDSIEK